MDRLKKSLLIVLIFGFFIGLYFSCLKKSPYNWVNTDEFDKELINNIYKDPINQGGNFFQKPPIKPEEGTLPPLEGGDLLALNINSLTTEPELISFKCNLLSKIAILKLLQLDFVNRPNGDSASFTQGTLFDGTNPETTPILGVALKNLNDHKLPVPLFCLKDELKYLVFQNTDIDNNIVEEQSSLILSLSRLERLDLKGNKLSGLPSIIGSLYNLKILNLSDSKKISSLENLSMPLQKLYLERSGLERFSDINCAQLREAYLSENSLYQDSKLAEVLSSCVSLTFLDLSENSLQGDTLSNFNFPKSLQSLYLNKNNSNRESLSLNKIGQLSNLQVLDVSNMNLSSVSFADKSFQELRTLDLSNNNNLKNIDSSIAYLKKLSFLNLSGNSTIRINPAICDMQNLTVKLDIPITYFDDTAKQNCKKNNVNIPLQN